MQVVHRELAYIPLATEGATGDLVDDVVTAQFHVMGIEVRSTELPVSQAVGELASVIEHRGDIGHRAAAELDARDIGLVHAQDHVGVLAAGVALGCRAIDIAGQGQVVADLPFGIRAIEVGVHHPMLGHVEQFRVEAQLRIRIVHRETGDDAVLDRHIGPAARREQRVVRLLVADLRRVEAGLQPVQRQLEAVARAPFDLRRQRTPLFLFKDRADAELAGCDQAVLVFIQHAVAVWVDGAAPGIAPQPAFIVGIGIAAPAAVVAGDVGAVLALAVHHAEQDAQRVVGEQVAVGRGELVPVEFGHLVAVAFQTDDTLLPVLVERTGRAQVDQAADGTFRQRSLRALDDVGAADHVGRQHVVGEVAASAIGGQDAAVEGG